MPNIMLSQVCKDAAKRQPPREPSEFSSPKSSFFDYYNTYNHDTMVASQAPPMPNTLVGRDYASDTSCKYEYTPSYHPTISIKPASLAHPQVRLDEQAANEMNASVYASMHDHGEPVGAGVRRLVLAMRWVHSLVGLLTMACFGAMEAYMLTEQFTLVAIPLTVCRLILVTALIVLVLSDWARPKRIHRYFPMYSFQHSFKALGISQLVIAFFALSDSTVAKMSDDRENSEFARILFPLVLTTSALLVLLGCLYFVVGVFGGAKLRTKVLLR
ncbi:hypothetical protein GGH20_005368 [Coemansia sp. RSA 1937]|nr:hypothetical protein GGH20_005368 [Coemansia sp. RSA 1937]